MLGLHRTNILIYEELLFWTSEKLDRIIPPTKWLWNSKQIRRKDYLGDSLQPRCRYALSVPVAASNSPRYGGEGFIGLEENSGWNWTPTKYGWSTRQMSKKIKRHRKIIIELLEQKFIQDFTQQSRNQISMCEFKGGTVVTSTLFHGKQLTTVADG